MIGAVLVLAGLGWGIWWALAPCRLLDRLIGASGCVSRVEVGNVSALSRVTMSPPDRMGISSLFGWIRENGERYPGMVRVDPRFGRETGRFRLPVQNGLLWLVFAEDGERALITCRARQPCAADGSTGIVVSLADAELIESVTPREMYPMSLPDEPAPPVPLSRFADGGRRIVTFDEDDVLRLTARDGTGIAVLNGPEDRHEPWATRFTVSPSGRYVALLDQADRHGAESSQMFVWDAQTGELLERIAPGRGYAIRSDLVWSRDERHLMALHPDGRSTVIDTFRLRNPGDPD